MIKHKPVRVPHVTSVAEFANVLPKVFGRDVSVRALDRPFQQAPMPLNRVGVVDATHPFLGAVVHGAVRICAVRKHAVRRPFVGADRGTGRNVVGHDRSQGLGRCVLDRPARSLPSARSTMPKIIVLLEPLARRSSRD